MVVSLVVVASLTLAAASTFVAIRTAGERNRANQQRDEAQAAFQASTKAIDALDATLLTSAKLKSAEPMRAELLQPFVDYYKAFIQTHAADKNDDFLPETAAASLRLAAIYAKMGSKESIPTLRQGLGLMGRLGNSSVDPDRFPSLQTCALRLVPALEWGTIKEGEPTAKEREAHGVGLFLTVLMASATFENLAGKFPQHTGFRDDLAALQRINGLFNSLFNRNKQAIEALTTTCALLEVLVREKPDNADFKTRLSEALVSLGKLQKSEGDPGKAIASYERAVVLRQELATSAPDDKTIAQDLKTASRDLERLKTAPAPKTAAPAADTPAAEAPATAEAADAAPSAVQ
jgi:tetratricopeptide (TPR) repeat protein